MTKAERVTYNYAKRHAESSYRHLIKAFNDIDKLSGLMRVDRSRVRIACDKIDDTAKYIYRQFLVEFYTHTNR